MIRWLAAVFALATAVPAAAECMTQAEARAAYPGAHIYWHGVDRCWDDRRGGAGRRPAPPEVIAPAVPLSVIERRWPTSGPAN